LTHSVQVYLLSKQNVSLLVAASFQTCSNHDAVSTWYFWAQAKCCTCALQMSYGWV